MDIKTFKRDGASVRAVMVEGEPMVLFRDLAALCGYTANNGTMRYYCAEPPTYVPVGGEFGSQTMRALGEADVWRVVASPAKRYAEERTAAGEWLFCEVFPSMRRLHAAGEVDCAETLDAPAGFVRREAEEGAPEEPPADGPRGLPAGEPAARIAPRALALIRKMRDAARESGNGVRANALADALAVIEGGE